VSLQDLFIASALPFVRKYYEWKVDLNVAKQELNLKGGHDKKPLPIYTTDELKLLICLMKRL
jgi:hypothetical protein